MSQKTFNARIRKASHSVVDASHELGNMPFDEKDGYPELLEAIAELKAALEGRPREPFENEFAEEDGEDES